MSEQKFSFKLLEESGSARLGKILTRRGNIDTPTFMTVGTQGTIKSAFIEDVVSCGAQIILSNTSVSYTHLTLPTILLCRSRWSPYH